MKSIVENDTIQIEITDACINKCANCTRFVGHRRPFFMGFEQFKEAVDSLEDFPKKGIMFGETKTVGIMGGEPLIHPEFERFCDYALSKINREYLGLWSCFPKGFEHYREVICRTFGNIFLNDHSRADVYHHPFLVAAEEVIPDRDKMFAVIDKCYFQYAWSASINPKGAYFCEMAAALSLLLDGSDGWKVEPGWWWRTPKDYKEQIEEFCPKCGGAMMLQRRPSSPDDGIDDISPNNFKKLKSVSTKIKEGKYNIHDLKTIPCSELKPLALYKEQEYRDRIAARYGIYLTLNKNKFNEPHLLKDFNQKDSLLNQYRERFK